MGVLNDLIFRWKMDATVYIKYGYIYNGYAARKTGTQGISSSSLWVLPTDANVITLAQFVSTTYNGINDNDGGIKLKQAGTTAWLTPNTGATNASGFTLLPGGLRQGSDGSFITLTLYGNFFVNGSPRQAAYCSYNDTVFKGLAFFGSESGGTSIRFMRTSTTLTDGQTGTYTGNDGKVYPTICIGTQEWMSKNLAETQYRDLTTIPIVTDNTDWSNLTTGAKCAYDNNELNAV